MEPNNSCDSSKHAHACHHHKHHEPHVLMSVLEKVCAVALGVLAAYVNFQLFVPCFFVGMAIGVYSYIQDKEACEESHQSASCASGFIEHLTGVRLPAPVGLAAEMAIIICHIDHHAIVFVPIVAVSLGNWAGKMGAQGACYLYRNFSLAPVRSCFGVA